MRNWDDWLREIRILILNNKVENLFNLEDVDPWSPCYEEGYTPQEAFDEILQEVMSQAEPV